MPLVLWSGGCDSTILLHDLLSQRASGLSYDPVRTVSFSHPQIHAATENKKARDAIRPILEKRFGEFVRCEVTISADGAMQGDCRGILQPLVWLFHAALHLKINEDLYGGYIKGDCVWHYRHQLYETFNHLQWMAGRSGSLKLPFEWTTKAEVIKRLKQAGLYRHTWHCEDPAKGKPCKKCSPCKTHQTALWQITQGMVA